MDQMRWVIFMQFLFLAVNSCQEFWQHWRNVSCSSWPNSCLMSKNHSFVQIYNQSLSIKCGWDRIDSRLMRCLDVKNVQEIKLIDCYLSGIDFGIFSFANAIENIEIQCRALMDKRNFESALFNNMSSLRSVEIRNVKTSELLNLTFRNVPSLTSLKIEWYNFTLLPNKPFRELINLSELCIALGELKVLAEDVFYNLHNLKKLDLSYNKIESIHPLVFRNLTKLEYLDLRLHQMKYLPSDMLKGLSNLRAFHIVEKGKLTEIPSGFFKKLHNLTIIHVSGCSLSSLEEVFSDLINLEVVYLHYNQIKHLPLNLLRNNKRLTTFSCKVNEISTLPIGIFNGLSKLESLELRENRLENLPENIFQNLSSLLVLDLSKNRLTFLPENIFLPLTNLTSLYLSDNSLSKLTGKRPFGSSKNLIVLNLEKAGLTQWPMINWSEYNLEIVDFSDNHFETVKLPIYTPSSMYMFLFKCKIQTIYLDEWIYGFQTPIYELSDNEINCNDELQQFISFFKSNMELGKKMFPDIENAKCHEEERNLFDNLTII